MNKETIHYGTAECGHVGQIFRTGKCAHCYIAELEAKYAAECEASMMAGSQLSALRLQLKDAEERASMWARVADQRTAEAMHKLEASK